MSTTHDPPVDELAARRNGAGDDAVDDPPAGDPEPELELESQLEIPGVGAELTARVSRVKPNGSEFRLRAVGLPLRGQLDAEARVFLLVEATVDDVGVRAVRKGNDVAARVRRHVATPTAVRVLGPEQLAAIGVEVQS